MKIIRLNTDYTDGLSYVTATVEIDAPLAQAVASVLALLQNEHHVMTPASEGEVSLTPAQAAQALNIAAEIIADDTAPAKATRTRRPRTNPDAAPVTEARFTGVGPSFTDNAEIPAHVPQKAEEALMDQMAPGLVAQPAVVEGRRRSRVTAPMEPEPVKVITDADLAKACSNAAAIITPDVGPGRAIHLV